MSKGYGFSKKEDNIPIDPKKVFRLASVSKVFTASAVMQLVEQGKIDVNRNIWAD
ncbi:serine hydrolase domain-containing protein [Bacillus thuringiensis]